VFELSAKNHRLYARSYRVVWEEIAKVRIVVKGATRDLRRFAQFSFAECPFIEAEVLSHNGAA
jgi:hypothetical protein